VIFYLLETILWGAMTLLWLWVFWSWGVVSDLDHRMHRSYRNARLAAAFGACVTGAATVIFALAAWTGVKP
jgi:hypothetical protein